MRCAMAQIAILVVLIVTVWQELGEVFVGYQRSLPHPPYLL